MTVEETLFHLKLHGWCLIENVIPAAEVNGVRQSIETTAAEYARPDADDINIPDVLNVNQSFAPYLAHAAILKPLRALWGPYVRMRTAKGFISKPGCQGGSLHADGPYIQSAPMRMDAPYQDFIAKVTAVWMLSPFTKENGGTLLVPGSHRAVQQSHRRTRPAHSPPQPNTSHWTGRQRGAVRRPHLARQWHQQQRRGSSGSGHGVFPLVVRPRPGHATGYARTPASHRGNGLERRGNRGGHCLVAHRGLSSIARRCEAAIAPLGAALIQLMRFGIM